MALGLRCSTPNCSGNLQTLSVGRIDQPDPDIRQYSYSGFCRVCRGTRAGTFFLRGDDLSVETALMALEKFIANADVLAQESVNAWGFNMRVGNGQLMTPEFLDIFEKACRYQEVKKQAEFYRKHNALDEETAHDETTALYAFITAYKPWFERHSQEHGPSPSNVVYIDEPVVHGDKIPF